MADKANNKRREHRLAQQLRANLMRRKQQARHRQDAETDNEQESAKESLFSSQHDDK